MNADRKKIPDFFEEQGDTPFDPVTTATGGPANPPQTAGKGWNKKKAGFYLPEELIDRFNRKYHQLNLEGVIVGNKSALLEAILEFGLEEMAAGAQSRILKRLKQG